MGGEWLSRTIRVAGALALGGCASAQMAHSERQTDEIVTDLSAQVEAERTAARAKSDKLPPPKVEDPVVPDVLDLAESLRVAGRLNRELLSQREGLHLAALSLLDARNAVGLRLAGSIATLLSGSDRAEEVRTNTANLSATDLLPTGATVRIDGDGLRSHGRGDALGSDADVQVTARITQPLLRGAGYTASHEVLTDAQRQALYDVRQFELSRQDLALRVQREYYGLVSQRQVIRNRELSLESFAFLKRRSERLFELDRVSEVDKFRAAREVLSAENALVDARQEYEARLDRFKILLGLETSKRLDVKEEIPAPRTVEMDLITAVQVAMLNRLDLMTARDEVTDAERRERIRRQEMLPDLNLEAVGTRSTAEPSRHLRSATPIERDDWSLGLTLDLPLNRVQERGALRAARIALARQRRDLSGLEDTVILEVRQSLRNLRSAVSSLQIQEQIVASEEKNAKVARMRFEEGEISNRDLTDALIALADARDRFVREQTNVETARTQLLRDLGVLVIDEDGTWRE